MNSLSSWPKPKSTGFKDAHPKIMAKNDKRGYLDLFVALPRLVRLQGWEILLILVVVRPSVLAKGAHKNRPRLTRHSSPAFC